MAELPACRVLQSWCALLWPVPNKKRRKEVKKYGVIFTCLAIRAVHREVASSLDTDACLNAIRRFIAKRGQVREFALIMEPTPGRS